MRLKKWLADIAFRVLVRLCATKVVRASYCGVLSREADAAGLAASANALRGTMDIAALLRTLSLSDEHWGKVFDSRSFEIVRSAYRGLLARDADPEGLQSYSALLRLNGNLEEMLDRMVHSQEFMRIQSARVATLAAESRSSSNPKHTFDSETIAFLHIQKTAGSTVNRALAIAYGRGNICFPPDNGSSMFKLSASELSQYKGYAGHFNFDELAYIPRKRVSVLCFVRNPKDRLLSLYYYWKAHQPGHPDFSMGAMIANALPLGEFVRDRRVTKMPEVWNHMTWAIMGERMWSRWQAELAEAPNRAASLASMRDAIRGRLQELAFVGLQEDFDKSLDVLFRILRKQRPVIGGRFNSLESRMLTDPHFKKHIAREEVTEECADDLERLLELDTMLYEEARLINASQCAEYAPAN
ncbi:MAG TPA: sulfotransferase family 2 domain-containing protein [Steroidobacteraceae bacterium]|nr:sulfotransferase family 2 domain-containing protein [Steroidobacteraceae bacterium]